MLSFKLAALLFQLATIAAYSFTPPCYGLNGYGLNGNFEHDIAAVASQNSLRSLMDCVRMDKYSRDYGLCEDADTYGNWFTQQDIGKQYCVSPRRVISITVQKQAQAGKLCAAVGGLDVCPIDNADYFDCLCTHSIGRDHISCLAWYFEHNTHYDDYTCGSNGKRDINPFQDMQMPIAGPRLSPNLMDGGEIFYIDTDGHPVWLDEEHTVGLPLPYYKKWVQDANENWMIQQCFIYPISPVVWCTTFYPEEGVDQGNVNGPYSGATFSSTTQPPETATPTVVPTDAEAFPSITTTEVDEASETIQTEQTGSLSEDAWTGDASAPPPTSTALTETSSNQSPASPSSSSSSSSSLSPAGGMVGLYLFLSMYLLVTF